MHGPSYIKRARAGKPTNRATRLMAGNTGTAQPRGTAIVRRQSA